MSDELDNDAGGESVVATESIETVPVETASNPEPVVVEENVEDEAPDEEVEAIIAEAQAEADKTQTPLVGHLRKVITSKQNEVRALSNRTPEYGEDEQFAIDLHKGLTSFDNENGRPTAKPFAEKLVAKDPQLALEASWDLLNQQFDANGLTIGHKLLERMGLDPHKLAELRQFSKGEIKSSEYGIVEVPENVPKEYADAYKSISQINRDDVDNYIGSDDPQVRAAGLEILRSKQDNLDFSRMKTEQERTTYETAMRDVNTQIERDEVETFTNFVESFKESPTYTAATVSGNPQVDSGIKNIVSMATLALGYPDSVLGQQSAKFFSELGVTVNPQEVQTLVDEISGNIQSAVKADKGGYTQAKAEALGRKNTAVDRASGLRNRIFADAVSKMAGQLKQVSEANGKVLESNGGVPTLSGNGVSSNGEPKLSTLEIIKQMSART